MPHPRCNRLDRMMSLLQRCIPQADAMILDEAGLHCCRPVKQVSQIQQHRISHPARQLAEVVASENSPIRHDYQRVSVSRDVIWIVHQLYFRQKLSSFLRIGRIERDDLRPVLHQERQNA